MVQLQHGTDGVKPLFQGSKENAKDSTIQLFLTPARIQLLDIANLHLLFRFISSENLNLQINILKLWNISQVDGLRWMVNDFFPFPETFSATRVSNMESNTQRFKPLKAWVSSLEVTRSSGDFLLIIIRSNSFVFLVASIDSPEGNGGLDAPWHQDNDEWVMWNECSNRNSKQNGVDLAHLPLPPGNHSHKWWTSIIHHRFYQTADREEAGSSLVYSERMAKSSI